MNAMSTRQVVQWAAVAAPPGMMAALIWTFGVDVPYWDEWLTLRVPLSAKRRTLEAVTVWAQHNDHRLVVLNLISAALARWSSYNLISGMYIGFTFQLLTLAFIWRLVRLTVARRDPAIEWVAMAGASLLLFWTAAADTWIWSIASIQFFASAFCGAGVVWALAEWQQRWRGVVVGSVFSTLGVLNAATGFPLLAVVPCGIWLTGWRGRRLALALAATLTVGLAVTAVYFSGWSPHMPVVAPRDPQRLMALVVYGLTYLGSPVQLMPPFDWRVGWVGGAVACAALSGAVLFWRGRWPEARAQLSPWILLALYSCLNAGLTALGRGTLGPGQAMATRYVPIATLFWVAGIVITAALVTRLIRETSGALRLSAAAGLLMCAFGAVYLQVYASSVAAMGRFSEQMQQYADYARAYDTAGDAWMAQLYEDPDHVRAVARQLHQHEMSLFNRPAPEFGPESGAFAAAYDRAVRSGTCALDEINGHVAGAEPFVLPRGIFGATGWAVDSSDEVPSEQIYGVLRSPERRLLIAARRVRRPDVADLLASPRYERSGFRVSGSIAQLPSGDYRLAIAQGRPAGLVVCEFPNVLTIPDPGAPGEARVR